MTDCGLVRANPNCKKQNGGFDSFKFCPFCGKKRRNFPGHDSGDDDDDDDDPSDGHDDESPNPEGEGPPGSRKPEERNISGQSDSHHQGSQSQDSSSTSHTSRQGQGEAESSEAHYCMQQFYGLIDKLALHLVQEVHEKAQPGRFLKQNDVGDWEEIPDDQAKQWCSLLILEDFCGEFDEEGGGEEEKEALNATKLSRETDGVVMTPEFAEVKNEADDGFEEISDMSERSWDSCDSDPSLSPSYVKLRRREAMEECPTSGKRSDYPLAPTFISNDNYSLSMPGTQTVHNSKRQKTACDTTEILGGMLLPAPENVLSSAIEASSVDLVCSGYV